MTLVGVEEHLARCLDAVGPLPPLDVSLLDALDCVLAEDVVSAIDLPAFDNSSMDGYAVVVDDVTHASADAPVVLPVVGDLPAGVREVHPLTQGSAVRIMTGAPVPPGATGVVPVELTDAGLARVSIREPVPDGKNIRRVGEDVSAGELLLQAGTRLGPRQIGLLAATGYSQVKVYPRPRVVVMSTGSEIIEPGRRPGFGQVSDSNSFALTAAVLDCGAIGMRVGIVEDDPRKLMSTLEGQLMRADMVITTGGVSAGAYDTVKEVLSTLGTVQFDKVAMQPGMPQGFGLLGGSGRGSGSSGAGIPIFTLPGNPVSSYISFEVFVRPALRKMMGEPQLHRPVVTARAEQSWGAPPGKRQYNRVELRRTDDEHGPGYRARPFKGPGSHLVADLAKANALAVVPEDVTQVREGDEVRCMLLERGRR